MSSSSYQTVSEPISGVLIWVLPIHRWNQAHRLVYLPQGSLVEVDKRHFWKPDQRLDEGSRLQHMPVAKTWVPKPHFEPHQFLFSIRYERSISNEIPTLFDELGFQWTTFGAAYLCVRLLVSCLPRNKARALETEDGIILIAGYDYTYEDLRQRRKLLEWLEYLI